MAPASTHVFRVSPMRAAKVYRDIEIASDASLRDLAAAIVAAFDFDFDHAFGFYSGKTRASLLRAQPKYELFADMDDADSDALSVEQTTVATAFPRPRHRLTFLFDYGDHWLFEVRLTGNGQPAPNTAYPRVLARQGASPRQYPSADDPDEE